MDYFNQKVVLITGGNGGIGRCLVAQLLANKAKVVVFDQIMLAADQCKDENFHQLQVDLTDIEQIEKACNQVLELHASLDIIIHCAGVTHLSKAKDYDYQLYHRLMQINLHSAVQITHHLLPQVIQSKGQIVAISSVAGFAPLYGRSAYSASKYGMEGYFQSLASEVREYGVGVTIVRPSFVQSRPELKAQVNDGFSSPGALKKAGQQQAISPTKAANAICKAIAVRQKVLYVGKVAIVARVLMWLCPPLYRVLMRRQAQQEFVD